MSEELGRIATKKIPASQAIPGNAEHARLISASGDALDGSKSWLGKLRLGIKTPVVLGVVIAIACIATIGFWITGAP